MEYDGVLLNGYSCGIDLVIGNAGKSTVNGSLILKKDIASLTNCCGGGYGKGKLDNAINGICVKEG